MDLLQHFHDVWLLKKTSDMYKETKDKRIQPTLFTYNAARDACAKCYGCSLEIQQNALEIAFAINKVSARFINIQR